MKKLVLIIIMFLIPILNYAEEKVINSNKTYNHSIGAALGPTIGMGLSYRNWFTEKQAIQVTLLPFVSENEKKISLGFNYLKKLKQGKSTNLLLYAGYGYFYNQDNDQYNDSSKNISIDHNIGIGPGLEFKNGDIVLDLMIGYALYNKNENNKNILSLNFTGGFGIYYNF